MLIGQWREWLIRLLGIRTVVIGDGQRGLLYRNGHPIRVLMPGVTRLFGQRRPLDVRLCSLSTPVYGGSDAEQLIETMDDDLARAFTVIEAEADEQLLLSIDGQPVDRLPPGTRRLYWKTDAPLQLTRLPPDDPAPPAASGDGWIGFSLDAVQRRNDAADAPLLQQLKAA